MQRVRLRFGREGPVRFISHLDTVRCWDRVFRRAFIPLEYSQGFTPHPKIAVAAPLAVGFTSEAELMDIWVRKWLPPESVVMMARSQLPVGFVLFDAWEVPTGAPALQTMIRMARYCCVAWHDGGVSGAVDATRAFLQAETAIHQFVRGDEVKSTDLRPHVRTITVEQRPDDWCSIEMLVNIGQEGSARPDHVLAALGFSAPEKSIHRLELLFQGEDCQSVQECSHSS